MAVLLSLCEESGGPFSISDTGIIFWAADPSLEISFLYKLEF